MLVFYYSVKMFLCVIYLLNLEKKPPCTRICCNRLQPVAVLAGETVPFDRTISSGESPRPRHWCPQNFAKNREYNEKQIHFTTLQYRLICALTVQRVLSGARFAFISTKCVIFSFFYLNFCVPYRCHEPSVSTNKAFLYSRRLEFHVAIRMRFPRWKRMILLRKLYINITIRSV